MATESRIVQGYSAWLYDLPWRWEGPSLFCHATIDLATNNGHVQCVFYDAPRNELPPPIVQAAGTCRVYYTADRYALYLDLLRNEGPIMVRVEPDKKRVLIGTKTYEETGE